MTRTAWIVLAVAAAAVVLWLAASIRSGGDARAPESSLDEAQPPPAVEDAPLEVPAFDPEPAAEPPAAAASPVAAEPARHIAREEAPPKGQLPAPEKSGPVDELAARFASDPRDAAAGTFEREIEAAFKSDDVPAALLQSVTCRSTVCKVETRWTHERAIGFMSAFTRLLMLAPDSVEPRLFDTNLGISPQGDADANGIRAVDVYIARLPQGQAAP